MLLSGLVYIDESPVPLYNSGIADAASLRRTCISLARMLNATPNYSDCSEVLRTLPSADLNCVLV